MVKSSHGHPDKLYLIHIYESIAKIVFDIMEIDYDTFMGKRIHPD
jgi:hypothetical protein